MHRVIRDHLEEVLTGNGLDQHPAGTHLKECLECRGEVEAMKLHATLLRQWKSQESEPNPGFYARVMDRIETQRGASVWNLFFESTFGRRLAVASLALALLLGGFLISTERGAQPDEGQDVAVVPTMTDFGQPELRMTSAPDQDTVLVNLVTYRER